MIIKLKFPNEEETGHMPLDPPIQDAEVGESWAHKFDTNLGNIVRPYLKMERALYLVNICFVFLNST